jgi:phosphatidylserine decarboxylase
MAIVAGSLGRRLDCQVGLGDRLRAGARLSKARFGSRVELLLPRDAAEGLPELGDRLRAGTTRIGQVVPL